MRYTVKNYYIAVEIEENGKFLAYGVTVTNHDNLVAVLGKIKNLRAANIRSTKAEMDHTVAYWNHCSKTNDQFLYDKTF